MPIDLQASTSSTSSFYKLGSEETYSLDKYHDETKLSKKLSESHMNNGFYYAQDCCVPLGLNCIYKDDVLAYSSIDRCHVFCSNTKCDQSGWIHQSCRNIWEENATKSKVQTRVSIDPRGAMDVLQTNIPNDFLCPCSNGILTFVDEILSTETVDTEITHFAALSDSIGLKTGSTYESQNEKLNTNPETTNWMTSFTNHARICRSRTLSDNQMKLTSQTDYSDKSPADILKPKKQHTRMKPANKTKRRYRQRRHSSSYHGQNSETKEEGSFLSEHQCHNSRGNIFIQRRDFSSFQKLPFSKQNAYSIQMEDDSCTGNDGTKVFLLSLLSQLAVTSVHCLMCSSKLPIYDHLPLIDGTFFLSPRCHSASHSIAIPSSNHPPGTLGVSESSQSLEKYLHVICIHCMHEVAICCQFCLRPWTGAQLLIGSLYTYDIFAAVPCCIHRLSCNNCRQLCIDIAESASSEPSIPSLSTLLNNFSQLSREIECRRCRYRDYHFVKPFAEIYMPI